MCGIAGVFHRDRSATVSRALIQEMTERLIHRGPDDGGVALLGPCALGHRRLSILDLSPLGHQPMSTPDGRYWITFNGEIYNYQALRDLLVAEGVVFRSTSDTEVLLYLYRREGERCVERLVGMYAFAVYDRVEHSLFLARDRLGKKPLYLWDDGERLLFASELKSLLVEPTAAPGLSPSALLHYMHTLYVPDPQTIYEGITRLPPARTLFLRGREKKERRYWQLPGRVEGGPSTLEEAAEAFEPLLAEVVGSRMVADVPLGAFLSGGVDSSVVVSEMRRLGVAPPRTTAIGFDVASQDESPYADAVARHFQCDHVTHRVEADATALLERLLWHFDEPFADASALPTYLLCQVTRQRVTVALSGDGGDEAFAGYDKYWADQQERRVRSLLPSPLWRSLAKVAGMGWLEGLEPWRRGANYLRTLASSPERAYFRTQSFTSPEWVLRLLEPGLWEQSREDVGRVTLAAFEEARGRDALTATQWVDITTYLPGDILTKVDRMSMAHALEVRCPLLDHRVIEFALGLPAELRLKEGQGKPVLKRVLEKRLPTALFQRPKHGFTIPVDEWFRGPLVPLFHDVVLGGSMRRAGLVRRQEARRLLERHQRGEVRQGMVLWTLLVLGMWQERIRGQRGVPVAAGVPARVEVHP